MVSVASININHFRTNYLNPQNVTSQVDELMGDVENASLLYSKAMQLLVFISVEAPSLVLNPPLSLTSSDRYRLRTFIDILKNRLCHSTTPEACTS